MTGSGKGKGNPAWRMRAELGRWSAAGIAVLIAHVLLAMAALHPSPSEMPSDPPAAVTIELEPVSIAPATPSVEPPAPAEIAPPPEPEPVEEPVPEPEPEPVEEPPPAEEPVVEEPETEAPIVVARVPRARPDVVSPPKPDTRTTRREEPRRQAKPRAAAPAAAPRAAPADAAPNPGNSQARAMPSPDAWRSTVFRHLARHKRYPRGAEASGIGGTVRVRFSIDANGNVLSHRITGSSGHPELDQAVAAMIARASPLPAPPAALFRPGMSLEVPIRFSPR